MDTKTQEMPVMSMGEIVQGDVEGVFRRLRLELDECINEGRQSPARFGKSRRLAATTAVKKEGK